ncbi:hypothetical protein [Taklimakanibacter deserti]|uniref:hypothetical protein n=1 Tax=Taklimakanibacter deserti TaxID=2267839 RepID=UPI000E64BED0
MSIHSRAAAYAAAAILAVTFATSGAQAYQCKTSYVQAEAVGNLRAKAAKSAKTFWTTQAKNQYGLAWSVWPIAASKSQDCNWTGNQFYCIVKAKPCLYVVP